MAYQIIEWLGWHQVPKNCRDWKTRNYFSQIPFPRTLRYSLGSANVNHNLTFVRHKRNRSHTTPSLEQQASTWTLKDLRFVYCHRSKLLQCWMTVVVIVTGSFSFPDLGEGVPKVWGSKKWLPDSWKLEFKLKSIRGLLDILSFNSSNWLVSNWFPVLNLLLDILAMVSVFLTNND